MNRVYIAPKVDIALSFSAKAIVRIVAPFFLGERALSFRIVVLFLSRGVL